eukprot:c23068_g1_i2 orf=601-1185(-)
MQVPLLSTLEEYSLLRLEKEKQKRRQRVLYLSPATLNRRLLAVFSLPEACLLNTIMLQDQRRLHGQLVNEQETLFGTKPSPNSRTPSSKKSSASKSHGTTANTPTSRRLSLGGAMLLQFGSQDTLTPRVNGIAPLRTANKDSGKDSGKDKVRPSTADDTKTAGVSEPKPPITFCYALTKLESDLCRPPKQKTDV